MEARFIHAAGKAQIPSPKDAPASGEIINDSAYGPCVVEGLNLADVVTGDPITVTHGKGPTIAIAAASGTTFAKAAAVEWDDTTKLAVAAAAGDFDMGIAAKAKVSGQTEVYVIQNAA